MSKNVAGGAARDMARRWQGLAERRRKHLIEMYRTGRWRHYYTEEQLTAQMRDAVRDIGRWSAASGEPPAAEAAPSVLREAAE